MKPRIIALALLSLGTTAWSWPAEELEGVAEDEAALSALEAAVAGTDDPLEQLALLQDADVNLRSADGLPHTVPTERLAHEQRFHRLATQLRLDLHTGIERALDDGRWATAAALGAAWLGASGRFFEEDEDTVARIGPFAERLQYPVDGGTDALALHAVAAYAAHMPVIRVHSARRPSYGYAAVTSTGGGPPLLGAWADAFWDLHDLAWAALGQGPEASRSQGAWWDAWVLQAQERGASTIQVWLEDVELDTISGVRQVEVTTGRHSAEWLAWKGRVDHNGGILERVVEFTHQQEQNQECTPGHWAVVGSETRRVYGETRPSPGGNQFLATGFRSSGEYVLVTEHTRVWVPETCTVIDPSRDAELRASIEEAESQWVSPGPEPLPYEVEVVDEAWSRGVGKARVRVAWRGEVSELAVTSDDDDESLAEQDLIAAATLAAWERVASRTEPPWLDRLPAHVTEAERQAERRHYAAGLAYTRQVEEVLVGDKVKKRHHAAVGDVRVGSTSAPGLAEGFDLSRWTTDFALRSEQEHAISRDFCETLPAWKELPEWQGAREHWVDDLGRAWDSPASVAAREAAPGSLKMQKHRYRTKANYTRLAAGPCSLYLPLWEG